MRIACYSSIMNLSRLTISCLCSCLILSFSPIHLAYAGDDTLKIIRFYKLNSKGQQNRLVIRQSRLKKPGCHNFTTSPKIYRLTQIGYEYCIVFAKKNCSPGTEISGSWKGDELDTKFSQGGEWLFTHHDEKGVKAKSWSCQLKGEDKV